jgi:hypothetical protein
MGYQTFFKGYLTLGKQLTVEQINYLNAFTSIRKMKRDVQKLMEIYKGTLGYPGKEVGKNSAEEIYGFEGEYFVGKYDREIEDASIIDINIPPGQADLVFADSPISKKLGIPSLWCHWCVHSNEQTNEMQIKWDGFVNFYQHEEWLKYLVNHFFEPWGIKLNGQIQWQGQTSADKGTYHIEDNLIKITRK